MPITYQWKADGVDIEGETSSTYTVRVGDTGKAITCAVTGSNNFGSVTVEPDVPVVAPSPAPICTELVTISGPGANVGDLIVVDFIGTWVGAPPITHTYSWRRDGAIIYGEISDRYTLQPADIGSMITCVVRGSNIYGFEDSGSNAIGPVT